MEVLATNIEGRLLVRGFVDSSLDWYGIPFVGELGGLVLCDLHCWLYGRG